MLQRAKLKAQGALKNFFGDDRQADSDDAILEQAKLKARKALENILLGDGAAAALMKHSWNKPSSKPEKLGNALLADGEAVHFDSASLEQAKLKAREALQMFC